MKPIIQTNKKSHILVISWAFFSFILAALLLRGILLAPGLPYTRDLIFPYDLSFTLNHELFTWDAIHSQRNLELNKMPIYFLFVIGSNILGSETLVKVFFVIVLFLLPFAIFVSLFSVFKNNVKSTLRLAIICGIPSILYLFNPWVVDRISNHVYMVLGMALNPLVIILYAKILENGGNFFRYFLFSITLSLVCMVSTHNLFYIIPILIFASFFYIIFSNNRKRIVVIMAFPFSLFIALNSYWILPIAYEYYESSIIPSYAFSIKQIERLSELNTPANVFALVGGGAWGPVLQYPAGIYPSIYLSFLIGVFSLLAIFFFPRNVFIMFLGVLFISLFILSLGTNSPIPIYKWLTEMPIFSGILWVYRDPSRLIQYVVLIYSILLAFTLYKVTSNTSVTTNQTALRGIKQILLYLILASVLVSPASYTFMNQGANRLISSEPPSQYDHVYKFFRTDAGDYKVLWLPLKSYYYYSWNKVHDEVAGDFYSMSSPKPTYSSSTQSNINGSNFLRYLYYDLLLDYRTRDIGHLLGFYDIKYVIVHTDLKGSQQNEAEKVIQILLHQNDMKLVKQADPYYIFENLDYGIDSEKFFALDPDKYDKQVMSSLLTNSSIVKEINIGTLSNWTRSPNAHMSIINIGNESLVKWDSIFDQARRESEIKLNLNNTNVENFDQLKIDVFPEKNNKVTGLNITLYTNHSEFSFFGGNSEPWGKEVFDLRKAKIDVANKGQELNLKNVTGIGLKVLGSSNETFNTYNSFYIRKILLEFDSKYGRYDSLALLKEWPNRESKNDIFLEYLTAAPTEHKLIVNASRPFILVFTEPYHSLWLARYKEDNGTNSELKSVPLYHATMNGFYLNKTGKYEIEILHKPQEVLYLGSHISVITLISALGYLLYKRLQLDRKIWTREKKITSLK
jgi:hypothetical protein